MKPAETVFARSAAFQQPWPLRTLARLSNNDVVYRVTEVLDLRDRLRLVFDDRELASADLNAHVGGRVEVCSHRSTMSAGLN